MEDGDAMDIKAVQSPNYAAVLAILTALARRVAEMAGSSRADAVTGIDASL